MPLRPIELSSAVARGFVADMRARAGLLGGERISGFGRDRPAKGPARESSGVTSNEKPARRLARRRAGETAPTTRGDGAARAGPSRHCAGAWRTMAHGF